MGSSAKETFMGSDAKQVGNADLMSSKQKQFLRSILGQNTALASNTAGSLLMGGDFAGGQGAGFEDQFQQGVVQPAMKTYEQDIMPAIQQRFTDANAGSSSALNQALLRSSEDLTGILGSQRIGYQQGQEQLRQGQQGLRQQAQMGALGQIMQLMNARQFQPIVQGPQEGILKDLIAGGSQIGAAAMMSSRKVKTNIRNYDKGLDVVRNMDVKQYDYTIEVSGNQNDRVGLIAEELPEELHAEIDGIKGVDLYGLVSTLVNCVKQLDAKVKILEAK